MIFKRLFLATLAALSLVACSDNDTDQVLDQVESKGDVIVTFAAAGGVQLQTRAELAGALGYQKKYGNFENTALVDPYCFKTMVSDPEFIIDHMTVLAFDESGKLVKTVSFKEASTVEAETKTEESISPNSIYQFGGIVLKEGTYKFILMGNINTVIPSTEGVTDFEKYQHAVVTSLNEEGYLPMVKVLENVVLTAYKTTASTTATATLNVITGEGTVHKPTNATDNTEVTPSGSAIELERLVARIDLASVEFDWKQSGAESMKLQLTGVCLVNASKQSYLVADNGAGKGYWNGTFGGKNWYNTDDEMSMVAIGGIEQAAYVDAQQISVSNRENASIDDVTFYAFAKSGIEEQHNTNWEMQLVLQCLLGDKEVYYYAPLKNGTSGQVSIAANHHYKMNVVITGDGSDDPGKKKEQVDVDVSLTVAKWNIVTQEEEANPTPVNN